MKNYFSLFGLALLLPLFSSAQNQKAVSVDPACAVSADAYDFGYRITANSIDQGNMCVNGERFRPVMDVKITGEFVSFQNYFYRDQFWKAELKLNAESIDAVFFHVKRFATVKGVDAAHTQMRYRFKKGAEIELTSQRSGEKAKVSDLVVSFEAAYSKEKKYNFALGTLLNYPLVARIGETATFLGEAVYPLEQYELNLTGAERRDLLLSSIQRSESLGIVSFYNTLRPNCTSEQFDLLDLIPRLKGKAPKFLTVLSGDPIATPSLQALEARGLLKQRVQDYQDEMKGKTTVLPVNLKGSPAPDFLPTTSGKNWSLVVVNPNTKQMSPSETKAFEDLRKKLLTSIMNLMQSYGSAAMLKDSGVGFNKNVLMQVIKSVQEELRPYLVNLDNSVSEPRLLAVYMVPYANQNKPLYTNLSGYGIEAAISIPVIDVTYDPRLKKSSEIFYFIAEGARAAGDAGQKLKVQAFLQSVALVVNAEKGNSTVHAQALIGVNPQTSEMKQANEQVKINKFSINPPTGRLDRASALITHTQKVREAMNPQVVIDFGPEGALRGTADATSFATFQVYNGNDCQVRAKAVPQLTGIFGEKPTGTFADKILQGRPVTFQVMSAYFDMQTQSFSDLDVNVTTFPVSCATNSTVNTEFTKEANKSVFELKKKLKQDTSPLGILLNHLF